MSHAILHEGPEWLLGHLHRHPTPHADLERVGRWHGRTRVLTWPLRRRWLATSFEGLANVPEQGGVILAANHLSFLDSVLLMFSQSRRVTFLGKAEYLSHWATRTLFPAAGMIPVDRSGHGVARSLAQAEGRLEAGEIVGIYPEGTRSRDGFLHRGHAGAAHLALRTGAPIVPVGIIGSDRAQPPGARIPRRGAEITVRFGAPMDLGPWLGTGPQGAAKREITDELMQAIAALSGQSYRNEYAALPSATD